MKLSSRFSRTSSLFILLAMCIMTYLLVSVMSNVQAEAESWVSLTSFSENSGAAYRATVKTNLGSFTLHLLPSKAPNSVKTFRTLASQRYFDKTEFSYVVKGRFILGGGAPGYSYADSVNNERIMRGVVAMAGTDAKGVFGNKFYIVVSDDSRGLEGNNIVFARVESGMDVVDKISAVSVDSKSAPVKPVVIESVRLW